MALGQPSRLPEPATLDGGREVPLEHAHAACEDRHGGRHERTDGV